MISHSCLISGRNPAVSAVKWFRPNPRVGARQRMCGEAECRGAPEPGLRHRLPDRSASANRITESPAGPMRVPAPLDRLPWEFAKDEFGSQRADFIGVMSELMVRTAKDEFRAYL
jgi:hypothetical protein